MSKETSELCWTAYDSLTRCALPQVHCASVKKSFSSLMHIAGQTSVTLVTVLCEMLNSPAANIRNRGERESSAGRFRSQTRTFQTGRTELNPRGPQHVILVTES